MWNLSFKLKFQLCEMQMQMTNANVTKDRKQNLCRSASICANVNAKYDDDDNMNWYEYEWFVGREIPAYAWLPQSSTRLTQGKYRVTSGKAHPTLKMKLYCLVAPSGGYCMHYVK